MRGTLAGERGPQVDDRFIPAHAGNTPVGLLIDFADPVHPRACGEHDEAYIAGTREDGSSPRMRGTHFFQLIDSHMKINCPKFYR